MHTAFAMACAGLGLMFSGWHSSAVDLGEWTDMKYIKPRSYLCYRAETAPIVDGSLNDPVWAKVPATEPFVDIQSQGRPAPRFKTTVKMAWDDQYFYIAAQMEEPHVWATLTQKDSVIFQDNDFEVFIDPNGDNHEYYELEINALNTLWDLFLTKPYKDGGQARNEWDLQGILTAVQVQGSINNSKDVDRGWSVEMALPWAALGQYAHRTVPPAEGDQWRVNFSRVEWRTKITKEGEYQKIPNRREDNWVWSPTGLIDMHRPEMWGYVQFTSQPVGKGKILPDPTEYGRRSLYQAYYAQRSFKKRFGRYAKTLEEIGLHREFNPKYLAWPLKFELNDKGYKAVAEILLPDHTIQKWSITSDSHLTIDE